jgi:hypothetical protein
VIADEPQTYTVFEQAIPVKLVGVYRADGGFVGELKYVFGHLVGLADCKLCDITHSPVRKKPTWVKMTKRIKAKYNLDFDLVHRNERTQAQEKATTGREPCVLAEYSDGTVTILLDSVDLKALNGSVEKFEKLLEARLLLFF